jgi:hypothetical protein
LLFLHGREDGLMKHALLIVGLLILCLTVVGCGKNGDKSANEPLILEQTGNGITAQLTISKNPVPVMKETTLTLALHDAEGNLMRGASVSYDLTMPGMTMPANQPQASETENGTYEAQALFTMEGDWRCRAKVTLTTGDALEFTFDFSAK